MLSEKHDKFLFRKRYLRKSLESFSAKHDLQGFADKKAYGYSEKFLFIQPVITKAYLVHIFLLSM